MLLDALERRGTLQETALELRLSRSAVSKSLGEVEAAAGCALFQRSRRGLKPNAIGLIYLRGARRMLSDLEATVTDASLAQRSDAALLRVGAPPFLGATLVPAIVASVVSTLPGLQMRLLQVPFPQLAEALHGGSLDCLLTSLTAELIRPEIKRDLHIEPLYVEHNRILAPRIVPWTRKRSWRLEELATARWVMLPRAMALRQALDRAFLDAGCIPPEPVVETNGVFSHGALAAAAKALVLLQEPLASRALAAGGLVALKVEPVPGMGPIALVTRRGGSPSPALESFQAAARKLALQPGAAIRPAAQKSRSMRAAP
jgi:DNA-binding transcriptional LysR family regulator